MTVTAKDSVNNTVTGASNSIDMTNTGLAVFYTTATYEPPTTTSYT